jgi:hypothetical protein
MTRGFEIADFNIRQFVMSSVAENIVVIYRFLWFKVALGSKPVKI